MQKNSLSLPSNVYDTETNPMHRSSALRPPPVPLSTERRQSPRFRVYKHLLSVCDFHAGQVLDISRTGLSFEVVHFRQSLGANIVPAARPRQSNKLDILSPGFDGYLFRNLSVLAVFDLQMGRKYMDNDGIIIYRRGVRLAHPLTEEQLSRLWHYFDGEQIRVSRQA